MLASAGADVDVAVVGAGAAGLAAAAMLRQAGRSVALLEAGLRTGGRAFTDTPSVLGGARFDHGAQWLHAADRNPLIPLARKRGVTVQPDIPWADRSLIIDQGQPDPHAAYEHAEARWQAAVLARLDGPDISLSDAAAGMAGDPWTPTIEAWEGAIIAAGDADGLSLRDWHANALEGENYVAPGGLGTLVARCLDPRPDGVHLGAAVRSIAAQPNGVRVQTGRGTLCANAAIVTVSTGVLRAEAIGFSPGLPRETLAALGGLPMGLLSKIVLRAEHGDRLGLKPGTGVFARLPARGAPFLSTIFWADGNDLAVGFVGGRAAWDLVGRLDEAVAFMRGQVAATLGHKAVQVFGPSTLATQWGEDTLFQGAYAYATPGHADARAVLATPLWDGRLAFAGEACATDGLAGTVAGAYLSGRHAAQTILDGFPAGG